MKGVPFPDALLHDGIVQVAVLVDDELAVALVLSHLGRVGAPEELAIEELDADDSEHELEQQCNEHNVADGFHSDDHTLKEGQSIQYVKGDRKKS